MSNQPEVKTVGDLIVHLTEVSNGDLTLPVYVEYDGGISHLVRADRIKDQKSLRHGEYMNNWDSSKEDDEPVRDLILLEHYWGP